MSKKLSIKDRIAILFSGVPSTPALTEKELEQPARGITIRFMPDVRNFLDHQADHVGCSIQDLVSMTMTSVMKATENPMASELELMCSRFRQLFQMHEINTFDIPNMIKSGNLTPSQLMDDKALLDALSSDIVNEVSDMFNISVGWVKGADEYLFNYGGHGTVYKSVDSIAYRLARYRINGERPRVFFVLDTESKNVEKQMSDANASGDNSSDELRIGVVIARTKTVGTQTFTVYDVLDSQRWNYPRCRIHLKLLMLFCEKTGTTFDGISLKSQDYSNLFRGVIPAVKL